HLRRLHAEDSAAALEDARANTAEIRRVVSILPAADPDNPEAQPTPDAIAAERGGGQVREQAEQAARARREADALFDRPATQRETVPAQAEQPWDPFDV